MKFIITICILTLSLFLASVAGREALASALAPAHVAGKSGVVVVAGK
jgi:hypothetical protein